jgi:RNA polymerase sigma factor (TIGR02999 family)
MPQRVEIYFAFSRHFRLFTLFLWRCEKASAVRPNQGGQPVETMVIITLNPRLSGEMSDATLILAEIESGNPDAAERLLVLVYDELRGLAAAKLATEAPGQTLQPTALVHEAWLRMVGDGKRAFNDRAHFFRAAAEAMRRILIDRARRKHAQRHGGNRERVNLEDLNLAAPDVDNHLLAVDDALDKLAKSFPVQAELVKLRYFVGMTNDEAANVLNISVSTAKNYWNFSRAWLLSEIEKQ